MTSNDNLIDFSDLDYEDENNYDENEYDNDESKNLSWPQHHDNLHITPIVEKNLFDDFQTDTCTTPKLVQGEDFSPMDQIHSWDSTSFQQNHSNNYITPNNMNLDVGDNHMDGFASRDVIMIGGMDEEDEEVDSSPDSKNTRDEYWSNSAYNTVVRSSNTNHPSTNIKSPVTPSKRVSFSATEVTPTSPPLGGILKKSNPTTPTTPYNSIIKSPTQNSHQQELNNENNNNSNNKNNKELCTSCTNKVYITERLVIDNMLYHRQCFKCIKCRRLLSMNNFAACGKQLFCQSHFLEIFRQTGNYNNLRINPQENPADISRSSNNTAEDLDDVKSSLCMRSIVQKFKELESNAPHQEDIPNKTKSIKRTNRPYSTSVIMNRSISSDHVDNKINGVADDREVVKPSQGEIIEEELPAAGFTKSLLSLWSTLGNQRGSSNSHKQPTSSCGGTPKKMMASARSSSAQVLNSNGKVNSPSFSSVTMPTNNIPTSSVDVVKYDETLNNNDELPPPQITKTVAAKFKEMEQKSGTVPLPSNQNQKVNQKQKYQPVNSFKQEDTRISASNGDHFDNQEPDELPEVGTTKHLVGFFKSIQN